MSCMQNHAIKKIFFCFLCPRIRQAKYNHFPSVLNYFLPAAKCERLQMSRTFSENSITVTFIIFSMSYSVKTFWLEIVLLLCSTTVCRVTNLMRNISTSKVSGKFTLSIVTFFFSNQGLSRQTEQKITKIQYLFKKDKSKIKSMHIQNFYRKPTMLWGWVGAFLLVFGFGLFIYWLVGVGVLCEYLQTSPQFSIYVHTKHDLQLLEHFGKVAM